MGRDLSPRDAFGWFSRVIDRGVAFTTTPTRIATENPDRIYLIFGNTLASQIVVGTTSSITLSSGLVVPPASAGGKLEFGHRQSGNLCQSEWWAVGSTPSTIRVIEVILERYPNEK